MKDLLKLTPICVIAGLMLSGMDILIAAPLSFMYASIVAMAVDRYKFQELVDAALDNLKHFLIVFLILELAYAVAECFMSTGVAASVINMSLAAGLDARSIAVVAFLLTCVLSTATGTSWGTFGILLPIVLEIFTPGGFDNLTVDALNNVPILMVGIGATLGGAVCGDHCSPISDTTIMASSGAQCYHINHVNTQLPYAMTVAGISFVNYVITGLIIDYVPQIVCLVIAIATTVGTMLVIGKVNHSMRVHSVR